ncbi:multicilin [Megalops cyprinoides]|uniref:multicilin n=1 Tax=Megalops cyprinoides TaxID=118141 RepID=UPI00186550A2|nr:multicilin [Megalops cyprinoides]
MKAASAQKVSFSTIAWQDLEDCTSVLRRESDSGDQQAPHQQDSLCYTSPACPLSLPQSPPQEEVLWRGVAEQHKQALGEALDTNSQLQLTLNQRQEEIASLRERNLHLKELASKAKHLASVLNRLIGPGEPLPPPAGSPSLKSPMKRRRLEDLFERTPACEDVSHILRDVSERCNAVLQRDSRLQQDPGHESHAIKMHGAFEGLHTSRPCGTALLKGLEDEDESQTFRTSVRDHCTIRTLAFPQGHAFTSRVPQGGYRFRWVPS